MTDTMTGATVATCSSPFCSRTFTIAATGRRRKYCNDNCRQDAKRDRDRRAAEAIERAEQLQQARAAVGRLFRPLEDAYFEVKDTAGTLFEATADDERGPGDVDAALAEYAIAGEAFVALVREYRDTSARIAALEADEQRARELAQLRDSAS